MNDHREFKDLLYEQFARVGKAVANPHRLELLDLLAQGERTVEELARQAALPVANASQHLQALRRASLVEVRREGPYAYYRLADDRVFRLWQAIREVGEERLAEVDRLVATYLGDRGGLEPVDASTLLRRMRDDDVVLVDVRPAEEYESGHIAGARSIPLEDLERRIQELPREREVIAYCRGPYCVFSDEAVALLQANGFRANRLALGLSDWRSAGLPVEATKESRS
jgi:rhodanese-related sulfurtransferase/DNA-binding transcriptional ArsR family regulator